MFYCTDILKKNNGKFGIVWLAAFYGTKAKHMLGRRDIFRVDICKACIDVINPRVPFSLRLQSNLMLGIIRVYKEQVHFFCNDLKSAWRQLQMSLTVEHLRIVDLERDTMSKGQCTFPDPARGYLDGDFETFPKDIFTRSPAELFSGDNAFITINGPISPLIDVPSPSFSSPRLITSPPATQTQAEKSEITLPDVEETEYHEIQIPEEPDIGEPMLDLDEEPHEVLPVDQPADLSERVPWQDEDVETDVVHTIDPVTGKLVATGDEEIERRKEYPDLQTPDNARIDVSTPEPPIKRRRRGQPIDAVTKLSDDRIKKSIYDVRSTLREFGVDRPGRASVSELFKNPACPELRVEPFLHYWRENAVTPTIPNDEFHFTPPYRQDSSGEESVVENGMDIETLRSPELLRGEETPDETSAIDHSKTSSYRVETTPITPAEISGQEMDTGLTPEPESHRHRDSSIAELASIVEEDLLEDQLEDQLDQIDTHLPRIEEVTPPGSPSAPPPDNFERTLLREFAEKMGSEDETFFHVIIPHDEIKIVAAKGFYQFLVWHSTNVVMMTEDSFFEDISIKKGAKF